MEIRCPMILASNAPWYSSFPFGGCLSTQTLAIPLQRHFECYGDISPTAQWILGFRPEIAYDAQLADW